MANITYTYEYVWYKSRYYPDKPFRMPKCYLPDSSCIKVKDESETITYTVEEAKAEVQRFSERKMDLEYKDRWNDNDYRMSSYYWRVICDLEKMIREAA